jgi:hypothetical protein
MRPTYAVKLPKTTTPKFPAGCIRCGAAATTTFRVASDAVGWWSVLGGVMSLYAMFTGRVILVPACATCRPALQRQRLLRSIVGSGLVLVGVALGFWLFREWTGLAHRIAVVGLGLVIALPYLVWDTVFPPAIDIVVTDNYVTYLFNDAAYARQFQSEN